MTRYNTGNPIGSTDPRDLYDNAQAFDEAINNSGSWTDRFGESRVGLKEFKIAVLGDSFCSNPGWGDNWPYLLSQELENSGVRHTLDNYSVGQLTFQRANSESADYEYYSGKNSVDALIASKPSIVIISLGFNDSITGIGSRTAAEQQSDADAVIDKIVTALPDVYIIYAHQLIYDKTNFPGGASLKNKATIPFVMNADVKDANNHTIESKLDDALNATQQGKVDDHEALKTSISAKLAATLSADKFSVIDIDIWKPTRLGLNSDIIHLSALGQRFLASDLYRELRGNSEISALQSSFGDLPDRNRFYDLSNQLWDESTTPNGDGWDYVRYGQGERYLKSVALDGEQLFYNWFRQDQEKEAASIIINNNGSFNLQDKYKAFILVAQNCPPNQQIFLSIDGGAEASSATVNEKGQLVSSSPAAEVFDALGVTAGTRTFQYRCGSYLSPEYTVTVTDTAVSDSSLPLVAFDTNSTSYISDSIGTWAAISGLSATIASSGLTKKKISASVNIGVLSRAAGTVTVNASLRIKRNGSVVSTFENCIGATLNGIDSTACNVALEYVDTFSTSGNVTYSVDYQLSGGDSDSEAIVNGNTSGVRQSTISVMEVTT